MGDTVMPLTDTAIRNAKTKDKPYKLSDKKGLYLLINKAGKYFRFDYRYAGKRKTMAFGVYPDVKLVDAKKKRDDARKLLQNDVDPSQYRKETKSIQKEQAANSFEIVAREWFTKNKHIWTEGHSKSIISRLKLNAFPWLGAQPVSSITDPKQIGELLRAIDGYEGHLITRCALKLAPLVFVRPGELRHAEWHEINFEQADWKIPEEKMKMRTPHMVPLAAQAIEVLKELEPLTGERRYVFPSLRTSARPMSNNTVLAALRRMGYAKEEMSGHGFRAMASAILHEQGWPSDVIERQLAHSERNSIKAAYNHAQHLPERRRMMQAWADYLNTLKNGNSEHGYP